MKDTIVWIDDDLDKETIAWIDDDFNIIALEENLKRSYKVLPLRDANEALNSLDALREARLVILDMIIPNGPSDLRFGYYTGLEILEILRAEHEIKTPVIVLTAVERDDVFEKLRELGVSQILVKPVLGSELREAITQTLGEAPPEDDAK